MAKDFLMCIWWLELAICDGGERGEWGWKTYFRPHPFAPEILFAGLELEDFRW